MNEQEALDDLAAMMQEPLHPDLVPYVEDHPEGFFNRVLKHPLVIDLGVMVPGHINRMYQHKLAAVAQAAAEGRWESWLWLHERPWRLERLEYLVRRQLIQKPTLRDLLLSMWQDTEFPHQFGELPTRLFSASGFISDDQDAWDRLPDPLTIYRGGTPGGISWTLDADKARWFARRFLTDEKKHYVFKGRVMKATVWAHVTGRGEQEIVAPWHGVFILGAEVIK